MINITEGQEVWFINYANEIECRRICNIERNNDGTIDEYSTVTLYHHRRPYIGDLNLYDVRAEDIYENKNDAIDIMIARLKEMK